MEPRCSAFFDLADEALAVAGTDGRLRRVNRSWSELGLAAAEASIAVSADVGADFGWLLELGEGQSGSAVVPFTLAGRDTTTMVRLRATVENGWLYLAAREDGGRRRVPTDQPIVADKLQAIGELAAGMAHEINTPIQFVSNNLEYLEEAFGTVLSALDAARRHSAQLRELVPELPTPLVALSNIDGVACEIPSAIADSIAGVGRVAEIVRAMNEFAHPQSDDRRLLDVHKIIDTAVAMTRSAWKHTATLELDLCANAPLVLGFGGGLGQVMLNLIVNAAHAIEEETHGQRLGTIRISTRASADNFHVVIADSGCGMTADVQLRIFDPFFTTKKAGRGTGQGLSLAYREITERHGGLINVVSAPGAGTEFHIGLPLRDEPPLAAREIAS